jgi:predicted MPP superfamily phosphohydrolase
MQKMKCKTIILLAFALCLLGSGIYGLLLEPNQVEVKELWIRDSGLARRLGNLTVLQISDLHISRIGRRENRVLGILDELQPDLIFLTGDYVSWKGDYETALSFLSKLKARLGAWAIMGDYDYSDSRKSCLFCHEKGTGNPSKRHRVKFLRNGFEEIKLRRGSLRIGGLDSESHDADRNTEKMNLPEDGIPVIFLCHNPLAFDRVDGAQDVLVLAGDTHGGQVPIPGWVWKILGYEKNARFSYGLFEKGRAKMFVSKGVGTSHVPIRIMRKPEVVVLHFEDH